MAEDVQQVFIQVEPFFLRGLEPEAQQIRHGRLAAIENGAKKAMIHAGVAASGGQQQLVSGSRSVFVRT